MKKDNNCDSINDLNISELSALRELQRRRLYEASQRLKMIDELLIAKRNPETQLEGFIQ